MKISALSLCDYKSLDYMERLVNNGSASGFSSIHTSSKETNPFYSDGFNVKVFIPFDTDTICSYGELPDFCKTIDGKDFIFFHPDWLSNNNFYELGTILDNCFVIPTSSVRTVHIENKHYYLKLCYPGKLGRIERELKYPHLISGIEITEYLYHLTSLNQANRYFGFMPEIGGKLYNSVIDLGYVVRKLEPEDTNGILIPAFSLFSLDKGNPDDELVLTQILRRKSLASDFFINQICLPLVDIFFDCAFYEGLIPEMHSQNIVFLFDEDYDLKKVLLRDLESIDKDISIRNQLCLSEFRSYPHKCIAENDEYYLMKHSFMYDHKLCEYLLDPMISIAAKTLNTDELTLKAIIKEHAKMRLSDWGKEFFPSDGKWYKYPNIEIDRSSAKRPFIALSNPMYR